MTTSTIQTRGERRVMVVERMLRTLTLAGVPIVLSCSSDVIGVADSGVASVTLNPAASTITVGAELPLQALVQDATGRTITDAPVFWSVRDPGVASVSSSGVVRGLAVGATQVAASAAGKSAIAAITVQRVPVASVVVRPLVADVAAGTVVQFTATVYDASQNVLTDRSITWSSSNEAVATVNSSGMASALAPGTATITATSEVRSDAATLTVTPVPVATVTVSPGTASVFVQSTVTLTATTSDESGNALTGRTVAWTTNAPAVATVSSAGVVTGVAPGTALITATSEGKSATATVTVTLVPVAAVVVQPSTATIASGSNATLTATVTDQNGTVLSGRAVTWSSSNPSVATVSSTGVVTGALVGSAAITATSEGKSDTATVTVTVGPIASVVITPASPTITVDERLQLTAQALDAAGNPISGVSFSWSSSDSDVASVTGDGRVTGKRQGVATISARTGLTTGTTAVTVTK